MNKFLQRRSKASLLYTGLPVVGITLWLGFQHLTSNSGSFLSDKPLPQTPAQPVATSSTETAALAAVPVRNAEESEYTDELRVEKNATVYSTLSNAGLEPADIAQALEAAKPIYDLAKVSAGVRLQIHYEGEAQDLHQIAFYLSTTDTLWLTKDLTKTQEKPWSAKLDSKPIFLKVVSYQGSVKSSLWQSASEAGLDGQVISLLSEIFAWQIDFEREIRPGDSWSLLIEQTFVDAKPYGWGNILVAEFKKGEEAYQAVRFPQEGPDSEYYTAEGYSLKGKFLKSPLKFSRISSRFQLKRFHPILGVTRPHNGVDYAAPRHTPVRAVGDGTISILGYRGGSGNMIQIKHNTTYQTAYKHLHNFAKGLKTGSKVSQGQVIGYVGATGLATGPHLHFEFYENGRYTDPLGKKFPREDALAGSQRPAFRAVAAAALAKLERHKEAHPQIAKEIADEVAAGG